MFNPSRTTVYEQLYSRMETQASLSVAVCLRLTSRSSFLRSTVWAKAGHGQ